MGILESSGTTLSESGIIVSAKGYDYRGEFLLLDELRYDTSWNWLMEAVEKCLIGEAECNEPVLITNIYDALTSISITGTFVAVVEYIKWYNNQIE